jgi:hypothetical protein
VHPRPFTFERRGLTLKGYLLLNQQASIAVSNSCINFSISFSLFLFLYQLFFLLISLEWLWSFFTLKDSMFIAALRSSLSWVIKHPVVAH